MKIFVAIIYCLLLNQFVNGQNGNISFPSQERVTTLMGETMQKSDLPTVVTKNN
jgi:hypothetical protein